MKEEKSENTEKAYRFASLSKYPFKKRLMIYLADLVGYAVIKIIGMTVRFEIEGYKNFDVTGIKAFHGLKGWEDYDLQNLESFEKAHENRIPAIFASWHDRLFLTAFFGQDYNFISMISSSFDGEYISRTAQRLGHGVVRGSSTRGGSDALIKMVNFLRQGFLVYFTVDGPRGPRYEVKKGAITLAHKTGAPIIAFSIEAEKYWTLNSWDKMQIPRPFTRAKVFIAEPVFISKDADTAELENKRQEVQSKLDELVELGKVWRESIKT